MLSNKYVLLLPPVLWGLLVAMLLFVSVLVHELAHSLVARAFRVKVQGITLMFLGGKERHFARSTRPETVYLAFHGAFVENVFDPNAGSTYGRSQVRAWIIERTGGKIDRDLLDRFLRAERRAALLYAFDPLQFKLDYGFSLYYCDGTEPGGAPPYQECEKLAGRDALSLGFVNAEERVRVRPSSALPPP